MTKIVLLALGIALCLSVDVLHAQTTQQLPQQQQPTQSLRQSRTACSASSQSLRVCQDDFRSCNSVCTARALDASADIASCGTSCCNKFNSCLRLRGCGQLIIDCN